MTPPSTKIVSASRRIYEQDPGELADRLRAIADFIDGGGRRGRKLEGVVVWNDAEELARHYEYLDSARYSLPRLEGWVVYRLPSPAAWETSRTTQEWGICETRTQAERLAAAWKDKQTSTHGRRAMYAGDEWYVAWGSARVSSALKPDADVEDHVRRSGAFS